MGLRINTNVMALNSRRHLFNSTVNFHKSMEKLSSGLRVNRAADDAAGLAISEGLKAEIRSLGQAARNAGDGISLVQTAEGYLDEVSNMLVRMKELTVQSMTGTLTDSDRSHLGQEYNSLRVELNRIAWEASFNGISLLDGTGGVIEIQVGTSSAASDKVLVDLTVDVDINAIPLTSGVDNAGWATTANAELDDAIEYIATARGNFGAVQNRLEASIRNINGTRENLAAANSRIRDVDVARETSRMTSFQILQQAGVAMLTQGNLSAQLSLSLLG